MNVKTVKLILSNKFSRTAISTCRQHCYLHMQAALLSCYLHMQAALLSCYLHMQAALLTCCLHMQAALLSPHAGRAVHLGVSGYLRRQDLNIL
jgi:hypothetical protein